VLSVCTRHREMPALSDDLQMDLEALPAIITTSHHTGETKMVTVFGGKSAFSPFYRRKKTSYMGCRPFFQRFHLNVCADGCWGSYFKPVSGAAMGLIKEENECVLTDIQALKFLGDMDSKLLARKTNYSLVNGYEPGLAPGIIAKAIEQARPARLHILEKMIEAIEKPRTCSASCSRSRSIRLNWDH